MKKTIFVLLILFGTSYSQVFNTAQVLRRGSFSLGINPVFLSNNGYNDSGIFFHGGYGIGSGMNLKMDLGLGFDDTYFGMSIEKNLRGISPYISFTGGIHTFHDVGLDLALNFSFPLSTVNLYTGIDSDIVFGEKVKNGKKVSDTRFLPWFFVGCEVPLQRKFTLLFEGEIALDDTAYNLFGAGVNFYF